MKRYARALVFIHSKYISLKKVIFPLSFQKFFISILLILLYQLILSEGGIIDYLDKRREIGVRKKVLNKLKIDYAFLKSEVDLIENNEKYQEKLVRKELGFISPSEYLIVFVEGSSEKPK